MVSLTGMLVNKLSKSYDTYSLSGSNVSFLMISANNRDLKLRPIIDQSNTFTYNAARIVSDYLQPLAQNEYVIKDTLYTNAESHL